MKIAIVGSNGYIGQNLLKNFYDNEIITIGRKNCELYLDLNDAKSFNYKNLENIDFIIFAAAISSPDKCAKDYQASWKVNVEGTSYFIEHAIQQCSRVLFLSSDTVYGEDTGKVFFENTKTNPNTPYGKMKVAVEERFLGNPQFKALRLSYVFSKNDKYTKYLINCEEQGKTAEVFHPFYRNVISLKNVIKYINTIVNNWDDLEMSVINAAGIELVSRVRIADELKRYYGGNFNYEIVKPSEDFFYNRNAVTRMGSLYNNEFFNFETFVDMFEEEMEN